MITRSKLFLTILTVLFMTVLLAGTAFAQSVTLEVEPEGTVAEGEQVTLTANVDGAPEGADLEYRFAYRKSGKTKIYFPQTGPSDSWTTTVPAGAAGEWDLGVQVRQAGTSGWSSPPVHHVVFGYVITEAEEPDPDPDELSVVSVEAINAKQVEITFSDRVAAGTVIDTVPLINELQNIDIVAVGAPNAGTPIAGDLYASLNADETVLTVTIQVTGNEPAFDIFDGRYRVTVDETAVTDVDGAPAAEYREIHTFEDTTRPEIVDVAYAHDGANKYAVLVLSEPVWWGPQFDISFARADGIPFVTNEPTLVGLTAPIPNQYLINLEPLDDGDRDVDITATVTDFYDFNGNILSPNPSTATVNYDTRDTVAARITSVTQLDSDRLRVTFDKPLAIDLAGNHIDETDFEMPLGTPFADITPATGGVAEYVIEYSGAMPTGLQELEFLGGSNGKFDSNGRALADQTVLVNITAMAAPRFVEARVENLRGLDGQWSEHLILTYDQNVVPQDNMNIDYEWIHEGVVETGTITTDAVGNVDDAFTLYKPVGGLSNSVKLDLRTIAYAADYTADLPAALVEGTTGINSVAAAGVEFTLGTPFSNAPLVTNIAQTIADNDVIEVDFNRKVDPATARNVANYNIEGVTVVEARLVQNDLTAAWVDLVVEEDSIDFTGSRTVTVSGVRSMDGVVMDAHTEAVDMFNNVRPVVVSAELTAVDEITVTFSKPVYGFNPGTLDADFNLYIGGVKAQETLDADNVDTTVVAPLNQMTFTISDDMTSTDVAQGLSVLYVGDIDDNVGANNELRAPDPVPVTVGTAAAAALGLE